MGAHTSAKEGANREPSTAGVILKPATNSSVLS